MFQIDKSIGILDHQNSVPYKKSIIEKKIFVYACWRGVGFKNNNGLLNNNVGLGILLKYSRHYLDCIIEDYVKLIDILSSDSIHSESILCCM